MNISRNDIRLLLFHEFRLGHSAKKATENICISMGQKTVSYDTAKVWFKSFRKGRFDLDDEPHARRPPEVDIEHLMDLIEDDPRLTSRSLAVEFECSHTAIENHLHDIGKCWKYSYWIPHQLTPKIQKIRVNICMELLTSHRNFEWLRNLITGDEKWVLYVNYSHHRQWLGSHQKGTPTPKGESHPKKTLLSIWWRIKGIIHWELLPTGTTVNANIYCAQLNQVAKKLDGKQDRIYFLHDNARPHVAKQTNKNLLELGWIVLPHPPYSPDLAPTDYHLFRSLADHLSDKIFDDEDHLKRDLNSFFTQKNPQFYENGILSLPKRWQQVIDSDGQYVDETQL